jgi:hypothetical protein
LARQGIELMHLHSNAFLSERTDQGQFSGGAQVSWKQRGSHLPSLQMKVLGQQPLSEQP